MKFVHVDKQFVGPGPGICILTGLLDDCDAGVPLGDTLRNTALRWFVKLSAPSRRIHVTCEESDMSGVGLGGAEVDIWLRG